MGLVTLKHVGPSRPGVEPMSHALANGFLTMGPPGRSTKNVGIFFNVLASFVYRMLHNLDLTDCFF